MGQAPVPSAGAIPVEHPEGTRFNRTGGAGRAGGRSEKEPCPVPLGGINWAVIYNVLQIISFY